jgi:pyrimidine-nucleoside phosphorylase
MSRPQSSRTAASKRAITVTKTIPELIASKRNGGHLADSEIRDLIAGFVRGDVADYQMSALAMAIYFRGMDPDETVALTLAMRDSGRVIDTSTIGSAKVDKHSTGGVGDKISLCLAPMVAACGVAVPMVSGRGLGHTGGTLDKLEAIPGFSVSMSADEFVAQVREIGCALIGQTEDIAPADKRLYALRDVTATVESIPLITASILAKKLAEGIDALVLDVKVGRGAFMKSMDDARALANSLVRVGRLAGKKVTAVLTAMDAPLGRTIGNALETREAFEILHGRGPADLLELTLVLGAEMLRLGGVAKTDAAGRKMLLAAIADGRAAAKMREIVKAQGGDPRTVDEPELLPKARLIVDVPSPRSGFVTAIDALELGLLGVAMGAGRTRADQVVHPAVGIVIKAHVGEKVQKGEALAELHLREDADLDAFSARARNAWSIDERRARSRPLVLDRIRR